MKTTRLQFTSSVNRSHVRLAFLLIALAFFALSPQARVACRQGCDLVSFNTLLGSDALVNNTTGTENTAISGGALTFNTTGFDNTATGAAALTFNTTGYGNTATGRVRSI